MKDILVLLETGAETDTRGLEHGAELARREGARLHLLAAPATWPRRRRTAIEDPGAAVESALADIDTTGVEVRQFEITSGRPYRAARSYALAEDIDLVITCCGEPPSARRESELRELRGRVGDLPVLSLT